MSRKRALKKQQKRQESALTQLEELYRRGAGDEFLARAAEQVRALPASPLAAQWAEAADRALRQSLARADFGRLERLLSVLRRGGALRPLAVLAEAVLDLAAGRLDAARSRLAGLEGASAALPRNLLASLQSLARDLPDGGWPLDNPYLQAAGGLFHALQNPEADREALTRSLEAVRAAAPGESGDLGRLLDSAGRGLSLLGELDALEKKLEEGEGAPASQRVSTWLHGPGSLLAATLTTSGPPLLAPLRHALHLRWRAVLERVAKREGSPGLVALFAAEPRLLGCDVTLPGGSLAGQRQGTQARQLLAAHRYRNLARLLRSRGETETESGTLAALWSLELWASNRQEPEEADEDDWLADLPEPPAHQTLLRLQQMAGEISRRFPPERRAEVALALRRELFDLCEQIQICEHAARAALSLLEHQPGDFGLLLTGVAGAVAGRDARTLRAIKAGLAGRGMAQAGDLDVARRLIAQIALESPQDLIRILEILRPYFAGGVWPEIVEIVAREMSEGWPDALSQARFRVLGSGGRAFDELRRSLDLLRPVLAGSPAFAAMELALDLWGPNPPDLDKRLKRFLAEAPGLERPLTAFLVIERTVSFFLPRIIGTARGRLARAVIERLDDRWQLWAHAVPDLAIRVRSNHLPQLEEKIEQLLAAPETPAAGRQILEKGLASVRHVLGVRRPALRKKPSSRPARKKPSRRGGTPQLQLTL